MMTICFFDALSRIKLFHLSIKLTKCSCLESWPISLSLPELRDLFGSRVVSSSYPPPGPLSPLLHLPRDRQKSDLFLPSFLPSPYFMTAL